VAELTLVLGNKNYSSWSLRAWLPLKVSGLPFRERVLNVDNDDAAARAAIRASSPSGKVPCLLDGDLAVWDSLAIAEYVAELAPKAGLWPEDRAARAVARSACAEMHSGFQALRTSMSMNIRASKPGRGRADGVQADVDRITSLWKECRARSGGGGGPFLFGAFTNADAFFAPVVTRFRTYGVELDAAAGAYAEAVLSHPAMREWIAAAQAETMSIPKYEAL
jgi:glutathione S-transferase